jgi:hypothetical protein
MGGEEPLPWQAPHGGSERPARGAMVENWRPGVISVTHRRAELSAGRQRGLTGCRAVHGSLSGCPPEGARGGLEDSAAGQFLLEVRLARS